MAIPEHFLFDSDYPTDKIAFLDKGEMTISQTTWQVQYELINTHIKTLVYPEGDWNIQGSSEIHPMEDTPTGVRCYVGSFMYQGECWICKIIFHFHQEDSGKIIEYRLWGVVSENEGKNADVGLTASVAKPSLQFTSDENYPKFVLDGTIDQGQTFTHDLGYIPITKIWRMYHETITMPDSSSANIDLWQPDYSAYFGSSGQGWDTSDVTQITKTQLRTFPNSYGGLKVYFRMYIA